MILLESWQPGAECGWLLPIAACLSSLREGDSLVLGVGDFVRTYMALTHSALILSPTSVLVSPLSVLLLLLLCLSADTSTEFLLLSLQCPMVSRHLSQSECPSFCFPAQ